MRKIWILLMCTISLSASAKTGTTSKSENVAEKSVIHMYRPARLVGFGWNFKLRINGESTEKVKNGQHLTISLDPGMTVFKMKDSTLEIELRPGQHYYLRAALMRNLLLGKPEMVEVSELQAKSELADL